MLLTALGIFAVTATGGLIMAVRVFSGQMPPWALSLLHAAFGAAGLVTLGLAVYEAPGDALVMTALGLFVIAALGGFFLASFHVRNRPHPKPVVGLHALLAVSAFAVLALRAFALV